MVTLHFKSHIRILSLKLQRHSVSGTGAVVQLLTMWGDDAHREEFMARMVLMVLPPLLLMQFEC